MADNDGHITSFDKAHYDQLIAHLRDVDNVLDTTPAYLGPSADLKLDTTLGSRFHPGSQDWTVAKDFVTQATTFGNSVHTRLTGYETDVRAFFTALKNAEDVFDDTDDLTTYDASKFAQEYPDVGGGTPT
ncbi:hypothetical protein GCM10027176_58830 [Actinoallomurus bryophytorum]|uniref:Uncharacterized protein n=1 Tax=Actinoallomurus bryophytorum TaxID=1490222 RepID=A0A543CH61_9ACTN|nr:hypothetical protein [Actinoallomurus bryophytorum]TQL96418.1 hypothetical protein FB559_1946 [Actinoallomurus bryophytorum]